MQEMGDAGDAEDGRCRGYTRMAVVAPSRLRPRERERG